MRKNLMAVLAAAFAAPAALVAVPVAAQEAGAAEAFNVETTNLGALMDDAGAKAVLDKHLPGFTGNAQIQQARGLTLKQLQQFAGDMLPQAKLEDIQRDLDKLPKK